jgi:RNA polymerase sigma-70 factor (ECF subfamily)
MTKNQNDLNLVKRLQAGDESAVAELQSRFGAKIFQLAVRYMKNAEDAEEVTQDVLLKVYAKIGAFRGDSALSSWIYRITFNTAMSRLRSTRGSRAIEVDARSPVDTADGSPSTLPAPDVADWSGLADDLLLRNQLRTRLAGALREMPEIYRVPVVLRDVQGLTTEEASALLKVKDQTLKSRLHRGRLFLRDRLAEFADGLTMHRPAAMARGRAGAELAPAA